MQTAESLIRRTFERAGVCDVGFAAFADCLPLLRVRAAKRLPQNPEGVIVCALPYYSGGYPGRNVARYAVCDDYHAAGGGLLGSICTELSSILAGAEISAFIDISPIREVAAAHLAGLGVIGRHGMLITPRWGAFVFIGCIVVSTRLSPSAPAVGSCLDCGRCTSACPTGALSLSGLDTAFCRSAITQKRGVLERWEEAEIRAGGFAVGCDICLEVCPLNTGNITPLACLKQNPLPILSRGNLDDALKTKAYGYLGRAVFERNLGLIKGSCTNGNPNAGKIHGV